MVSREERMKGFYDEKHETMPRKEQKEFQEKLIREFCEYAYNNTKYYHDKFDVAGIKPIDIKTLEDFHNVPLTQKSELVEIQKNNPPFGGLLAIPLNDINVVFRSPGPLLEGFSIKAATSIGNSLCKALYSNGFRKGDIVNVTFSFAGVPAGLGFTQGVNLLGAISIPMGTGKTDIQIELMKQLNVTGFIGTPSFLGKLGKKATKKGVKTREELSIDVGCFTAEPLPESLRKNLEDTFDMMARQVYGIADLGIIGRECGLAQGMHLEESMVTEIVDPNTKETLPPGERGEVIVTVPYRRAIPFIRFCTGDASRVMDEAICGCGRTSPKLERWLGRVNQIIKVKGQFLHPKQVKNVLKKHGLKKFQVVVTRPDNISDVFVIKVEYEGDPSSLPIDDINKELADAIILKPNIEFVKPGEIKGKEEIVDLRKFD
ncbi:MAG: AMP-binding protein [Candidatus Helarchaeota archaeon]|nr:AMP-binding protein [Candidatus Helarchaeota archaeon]